MLNRLSTKYQKEIALSLLAIFCTTGFASLKAQAMVSYNAQSEIDYHYNSGNNRLIKTRDTYSDTQYRDHGSNEGLHGNNQNDLIQTNLTNSFANNNQLASFNAAN